MIVEKHCPLCAASTVSPYFSDRRRAYLCCGRCGLVYVPRDFFLDRDAERAEYELHQNAVADPHYRAFLSRLAQPLVERLASGARGLDFGCGPAPALAHMLCEQGFEVSLYDSFFLPREEVFSVCYDFVCATEVVEHLHRPAGELARLWSVLRPGGWLAVMTKLVLNQQAFATWHYKNDPTHVCFFSAGTWRWWAARQGAELELLGADVILLRKPG